MKHPDKPTAVSSSGGISTDSNGYSTEKARTAVGPKRLDAVSNILSAHNYNYFNLNAVMRQSCMLVTPGIPFILFIPVIPVILVIPAGAGAHTREETREARKRERALSLFLASRVSVSSYAPL